MTATILNCTLLFCFFLQQSLFLDQFYIPDLPKIAFNHKGNQRMVFVLSIMRMAEMTDGTAHRPDGICNKSAIFHSFHVTDR